MSLFIINRRPAIKCDLCYHRFGVTELSAVKWTDMESVLLLCEPCVLGLAECWSVKQNGKTFEAMPALRYFQMLIGGRTVQADTPPQSKPTHDTIFPTQARSFLLPPPSFSPKDVH